MNTKTLVAITLTAIQTLLVLGTSSVEAAPPIHAKAMIQMHPLRCEDGVLRIGTEELPVRIMVDNDVGQPDPVRGEHTVLSSQGCDEDMIRALRDVSRHRFGFAPATLAIRTHDSFSCPYSAMEQLTVIIDTDKGPIVLRSLAKAPCPARPASVGLPIHTSAVIPLGTLHCKQEGHVLRTFIGSQERPAELIMVAPVEGHPNPIQGNHPILRGTECDENQMEALRQLSNEHFQLPRAKVEVRRHANSFICPEGVMEQLKATFETRQGPVVFTSTARISCE